ncbi:helix-turn-helix transcriptional regulator [Sphingomonas phyllosphaerae]|uniref:helix-turn-helix transcriptional regulator n=1 Tax=Sphingomonas phyllosphaerae TaxID=257003 RepID=UPI0003F77C66|nr:helix-turn-helix transcriptional regulator [Sphingomonas phyllosphaerae]
MNDERDALIHGAYLAAMDDGPEGWTPWLVRASHWVGGAAGYLAMVDRAKGVLTWNTIHHVDPAAPARYEADRMHLLDPQVPVVARLEQSRLYRDTDVLDRDDPRVDAYLRWMETHSRTRHFVTSASVIGNGRWVGGLSVHNALSRGEIDDEQWRRLASLTNTLEQALTFGVLHAEKLREQWWNARLDAAGEPAALLDESGVVLRATPDFEAALRRGDGLRIRDGRLAAADAASQRRLAALIERATAPHGVSADAVRIERVEGGPGYLVSGWPLASERRALVPDRAAILVTLVDPLAAPTPPVALWRGAFGLTAREADLAVALFSGRTLEEAAVLLGITINTIRVHLRQIFAKTQTARQSELLRLLSRFG